MMNKVYLFAAFLSLILTSGHSQSTSMNEDYLVADFQDMSLEPDSFWNGSDESGGFTSGPAWFVNNYNPAWMSWSGFSYSNMTDDSTAGFMNQYSAITAAGYDPVASGGMNYAVAYVPADWVTFEPVPVTVRVTDPGAKSALGCYVTNSTSAALSMEFGDDYAKKFGGISGDEPDWFMLTIKGHKDGIETGSVDFYLADYRFENNAEDYIVKDWQWVDLTPLGETDSLKFSLSSSDTGAFGMNTPSYFCMDNLTFNREYADIDAVEAKVEAQVYPNPSGGQFRINVENVVSAELSVHDMSGRRVYFRKEYRIGDFLDLNETGPGSYIIYLQSGGKSLSDRIVISD